MECQLPERGLTFAPQCWLHRDILEYPTREGGIVFRGKKCNANLSERRQRPFIPWLKSQTPSKSETGQAEGRSDKIHPAVPQGWQNAPVRKLGRSGAARHPHVLRHNACSGRKVFIFPFISCCRIKWFVVVVVMFLLFLSTGNPSIFHRFSCPNHFFKEVWTE